MALPSLMQRSVDLPVRSHGSALSSPSRQRRASGEHRHVPEITLYLEQKRTRPGTSPYLESVQVPISSTVKDVRLKLQNLKGWHADKAKCSLVRNSVLHLLGSNMHLFAIEAYRTCMILVACITDFGRQRSYGA